MQIASLQQYITINSTGFHIRSGRKQPDGAWKFQELEEMGERLLIAPLQFELALKDFYEGISLPTSPFIQ